MSKLPAAVVATALSSLTLGCEPPPTGDQPDAALGVVSQSLAVDDANARLEQRRDLVASYLTGQYQKGGLGSWANDGSMRSLRYIAAGLLSLDCPGAISPTVPSTFPATVNTWTKDVNRFSYEGSEGYERTGDYDMNEKELVSLLYFFKDKPALLSNDAIFNLIVSGTYFWHGTDTSRVMRFVAFNGLRYPETENHVLMILSTQYLINQWMYHNYRNDPRLRNFGALTAIAELSDSPPLNVSIKSADYFKNTADFERVILSVIGRIPHAGFFETNARAYQAFSLHALFNLYAFADSPAIRAAAKNALDYAATKFAFQALDSKRFSPHRRHYEYTEKPGIWENDPSVFMWAMLSGAYSWPDWWRPDSGQPHDLNSDFFAYNAQSSGHSLWAALFADEKLLGARRYQIPAAVHDFMLNKHDGFWARFQERFTENHYLPSDDPRYFNSDGKTPYLSGTFEAAPEHVFMTPEFMNVSGGNHNEYPLKGEACGCKHIYDFWARPSAVLSKGNEMFWYTAPDGTGTALFTGDWGSDPKDSRTKMDLDIMNMSSNGNSWWYGNNLGTYKNFTYGTDLVRPPRDPIYPLYQENGRTDFPTANGLLTFRFQQVYTDEENFYYLVLGNAGHAPHGDRYFWEVVPGDRFADIEHVKDMVLSRNYGAGLSSDGTSIDYALTNGDIVSLDPNLGPYPILAVYENGQEVPLGRVWYDARFPDNNPLIEVRAIDHDYHLTGTRYAETPASGVIYVWNPYINRFLLIDSSDPQNPRSEDRPGPPLRYHRQDEVWEIAPGDGSWGNWYGPSYCPEGQYAIGYKLRVEASQKSGDDTALNAIQLDCKPKNGSAETWVSPHSGFWGNWTKAAACTNANPTALTNFVTGARARIEPSQGSGDDTGANDVQLSCSGGGSITTGQGANWGVWGQWKSCPGGSAVCGVSVRTESSQGSGDDTAMNGLRLACCRL